MTKEIGTTETAEDIMRQYRERMAERAARISTQISAAPANNIRLKGRVFTMPDGVTNPGPLKAVIVDWVSHNSLFEGAYNPNKSQSPVCWAIGDMDTLTPSETAPKRQTTGDCFSCPKNQWGTAANGGNGKACKNQMKIALIPSDLTKADPSKLFTINISPTGIKIFSAFVRRVRKLLGEDALPMRVQCEISFDPAQTYPTLLFTETQPNPNLKVALDMLDDARELLMREPRGGEE